MLIYADILHFWFVFGGKDINITSYLYSIVLM